MTDSLYCCGGLNLRKGCPIHDPELQEPCSLGVEARAFVSQEETSPVELHVTLNGQRISETSAPASFEVKHIPGLKRDPGSITLSEKLKFHAWARANSEAWYQDCKGRKTSLDETIAEYFDERKGPWAPQEPRPRLDVDATQPPSWLKAMSEREPGAHPGSRGMAEREAINREIDGSLRIGPFMFLRDELLRVEVKCDTHGFDGRVDTERGLLFIEVPLGSDVERRLKAMQVCGVATNATHPVTWAPEGLATGLFPDHVDAWFGSCQQGSESTCFTMRWVRSLEQAAASAVPHEDSGLERFGVSAQLPSPCGHYLHTYRDGKLVDEEPIEVEREPPQARAVRKVIQDALTMHQIAGNIPPGEFKVSREADGAWSVVLPGAVEKVEIKGKL